MMGSLSMWKLGAGVAAALCVSSYLLTKLRAPGFHVQDKHVFITGGSLGIGLSVAKKYAQAGAKVTIVARNGMALQSAKTEIESVSKTAYPVCIQSCDVTDFAAMEAAVLAATGFHGRVIDHVICCAGFSVPGYFADQKVEIHRQVMDVNYFGVLHTIKAALPSMMATPLVQAKESKRRVVIVSSGLGLISWVGYASYSPSKFALRGLAEALRNELILYDIAVSIYYPGNVGTPGYSEQDPMRPDDTKLITGVSVVTTPDSAAQSLINGLSDGHYAITNDVMVYFLRTIANGVIPRSNTPLELVLMPLVVVIQMGYGLFMDLVVKQSRTKNANKMKNEHDGATITERTALV